MRMAKRRFYTDDKGRVRPITPKHSTHRRRILKITLRQSGTSDYKRDVKLKALPPGKRRSRSGKIYWETRRNRSDLYPSERI
jgi:hypothetical protein